MPEPVAAVGPQSGVTQIQIPTAGAPAPAAQTFTLADVEALVTSRVNDAVGHTNAALRRLTEGRVPPKPEVARPDKDRITLLENQVKDSHLRTAARQAGVDETHFDDFKVLFNHQHGSGLQLGEDGVVTHVDAEGQAQTLGDVVKAFVSKKAIFKAPVKVPAGGGLRSGQSVQNQRPTVFEMMQNDPDGYAKLSDADRERMAAEDFRNGK